MGLPRHAPTSRARPGSRRQTSPAGRCCAELSLHHPGSQPCAKTAGVMSAHLSRQGPLPTETALRAMRCRCRARDEPAGAHRREAGMEASRAVRPHFARTHESRPCGQAEFCARAQVGPGVELAGLGGGRAWLDLQADAVFGCPESRVGKRRRDSLRVLPSSRRRIGQASTSPGASSCWREWAKRARKGGAGRLRRRLAAVAVRADECGYRR